MQYSRSGLLSTPEVYLGLACLRYLVDKSDSQAVAEIIALESGMSPEQWLDDRLEYTRSDHQKDTWGKDGACKSQAVCALDQERRRLRFLSPVEALDLALNTGEVERIVRAWGPPSLTLPLRRWMVFAPAPIVDVSVHVIKKSLPKPSNIKTCS